MRPHPFSIRQLQYAVAVADAGNFRLAAERCHVSQPSLSAQLAQLETALGARLFERGRGKFLLTAAGETLVARARRVISETDDLFTTARQFHDPLAGTLRIGVIPTVSPYLLPEIAPAVSKKLPRLTVLWSEEKTDVLLARLAAGALDAALLARVADMHDLASETVMHDPFVLAGPPGHPLLRRKRDARPDELDGHQVLLLDDGHCLRDQALALCTRTSAKEADFRATSLATLAQMVVAGAGVTLLPTLALAVENRRGELAVRRFAAPTPGRTIVLAWRKQSPLATGLRALAAALHESARRLTSPRPTRRRPPI